MTELKLTELFSSARPLKYDEKKTQHRALHAVFALRPRQHKRALLRTKMSHLIISCFAVDPFFEDLRASKNNIVLDSILSQAKECPLFWNCAVQSSTAECRKDASSVALADFVRNKLSQSWTSRNCTKHPRCLVIRQRIIIGSTFR